MAPLRAPLALSAVLAVLLTGCVSQDLVIPKLPAGGECCSLDTAVPEVFLRRSSGNFSWTQRLCSAESPVRPYTIFAGFDPRAGNKALFGCGSRSGPACVRRQLRTCKTACLLSQTCFLRFDTATPFLVEQKVQSNTRTLSGAVVETNSTETRSGVDVKKNGETHHTNETESIRNRIKLETDEKTRTDFHQLDLNSRSLGDIGKSILPSSGGGGLTDPGPLSPRRPLRGIPPSASDGEGFCCSVPPADVPAPLAGVSNLQECRRRCENTQRPQPVQISADKWGCVDRRLGLTCNRLTSCDNCLASPTCLTLYSVSLLAQTISRRRTNESSGFGVTTARNNDVLNIDTSSGPLIRTTRLRDSTVKDVTGTQDQRRISVISSHMNAHVRPADGTVQGGLVVSASTSGSGTRTVATKTSRGIRSNDRIAGRRDIRLPGVQGFSEKDTSTNTTINRLAQQHENTSFTDATRSVSSSGNMRGELLPGLRGPQDGNASLSARQQHRTVLGRNTTVRLDVGRRSGRDRLQTAAGGTVQSERRGGTIATGVSQVRSRTDSTESGTNFTSQDRSLGGVTLGRKDRQSTQVISSRTASGSQSGDSSRTIATCGRGDCATDRTVHSEARDTNHTTGHTEVVTKQTEKRSSVTPDKALPSVEVMAGNTRQARTDESQGQSRGSTRTTTQLRTEAPGYRSSHNRDSRTSKVVNTTEHSLETKKRSVIRVVTV